MIISNRRFVFLALGALSAVGCARQPLVQSDTLPLKRVVIYRNGVGYFERAGHVEDDRVQFRMKGSEVGDFLATLAVMEKGGSSVRAAAFPLDVDDDAPGTSGDSSDDRASKAAHLSDDERRGIKKVVLALDGKAHDLDVGYIAAAPVWRPSYRLVVHDDGQADLQAWGIVQNVSGEDWRDVKLSLVTGAPLAFESQLGTPVIPRRPTVTDEGEVIGAVPRAETSLAQQPPPPATAMMAPAPPSGAPMAALPTAKKEARHHGPPAPAPKSVAAAEPMMDTGEGYAATSELVTKSASALGIAPPRNLQSLAAVAAEAGTTRYDLPDSVTVPDKSATMVMLLSRKVAGESIYLFAPDGGVPDSSHHPFRVARFTNGTGGALERGPIAVFEEGSFLGQGMVDPLPIAATTTVPFALERSLALETEQKHDELGARVHEIDNGRLVVERDESTRTLYKVKNGGDRAAKILVKHPRAGGTQLFQPPTGTDDNVGAGSALVPATIAARSTSTLTVDERATAQRFEDWFGIAADEAVKRLLADSSADRDVAQKLTFAWSARKQIVDLDEKRAKLAQEQSSLSQETEETRRNVKALEKTKGADALRSSLAARLGQMAARLDDLTRDLVETDSKLAELRVQFKETIRDIHYLAPAAAKST